MQRHHRLTGSTRISEIHSQGRSVANGLLVLRLSPNGLDRTRYCFIAGKRVGGAVVRNRVKRRLREVFRQAECVAGWDAIVMARKGAADADYGDLEKAAYNLMRRTDLIGERSQR